MFQIFFYRVVWAKLILKLSTYGKIFKMKLSLVFYLNFVLVLYCLRLLLHLQFAYSDQYSKDGLKLSSYCEVANYVYMLHCHKGDFDGPDKNCGTGVLKRFPIRSQNKNCLEVRKNVGSLGFSLCIFHQECIFKLIYKVKFKYFMLQRLLRIALFWVQGQTSEPYTTQGWW